MKKFDDFSLIDLTIRKSKSLSFSIFYRNIEKDVHHQDFLIQHVSSNLQIN